MIFEAVSLFAGPLPRVLFGDNNKDVISNNLATLKLVLPKQAQESLLLGSPGYQPTVQCFQIAKQSKL